MFSMRREVLRLRQRRHRLQKQLRDHGGIWLAQLQNDNSGLQGMIYSKRLSHKQIDAILFIVGKQRRATRGSFLHSNSFHKAIAPGEHMLEDPHECPISYALIAYCSAHRGAVLQPDAGAGHLGVVGAGATLYVAQLLCLV